MIKTSIGNICKVKTGKFDANHAVENGQYCFFTCALEPTLSDTYSFDDEVLILPGNGANVGEVIYFHGKLEAYQRTYVLYEFQAYVKFVYYFFRSFWRRHISKCQVGSATNYIKLNDILSFEIPLPPLPIQKKIAAILDAAEELQQKDKAIIAKYNELTQSLFLDMFGDPVTNPKGWDNSKLEFLAEIISGVTKGRKIKSSNIFDIPYLRVANVQDGYLDLSEIKTIEGTQNDLDKYVLEKGDVLLTEGGDYDKLGRGSVWNGEIHNCIHQNHVFRVRLDQKRLIPLFFSKLCGSSYGKRYFLKSGKQTTGIASINKTQLKNFPVLLPPSDLQNQFAERVKLIEEQKQLAEQSLLKSQDLFQCLLQKAFRGELVS